MRPTVNMQQKKKGNPTKFQNARILSTFSLIDKKFTACDTSYISLHETKSVMSSQF